MSTRNFSIDMSGHHTIKPTQGGFEQRVAARYLTRCDAHLAQWTRKIGPLDIDFQQPFRTVEILARSILHPPLSGRAAATITVRVEQRRPRGWIGVKGFDALSDLELCGCSGSANKIAALRDLARCARCRRVPGAAELARLDDEAIIERRVSIRGIGHWAVQRLPMFRLGRSDVIPVDVLGVRKGAVIVLQLDPLPTAGELQNLTQHGSPYRTLGSMILWRAVDFDRGEVKP